MTIAIQTYIIYTQKQSIQILFIMIQIIKSKIHHSKKVLFTYTRFSYKVVT